MKKTTAWLTQRLFSYTRAMDDMLHHIVVSHLLGESSPSTTSLLAFVKLQAIHRPTWLRFRHDRVFWERIALLLPRWSLPEHMGLRRRVITGIKLMYGKCIACGGPAPRVFMAFQSRLCRVCCHRLLVSDMELAWGHGVDEDSPVLTPMPFIVRYHDDRIRVRFYMRQHLVGMLNPEECVKLTAEQCARFRRAWPAMEPRHVKALIDRMT
jgi:hypothetical protein